MDMPGVSVVIPVKGRVAELRDLLASLSEAVARCPEPAEVIVVDDSEPEQAGEHRANCARYGARYVSGPRHVGAKRNLGAARSRYDLLLFVDSDCRAEPDLLYRHVERLRAEPVDVAGVAGPTITAGPTPSAGPAITAGPAPSAGPTITAGPVAAAGRGARLFRIMRESHLLNGDLERPLTEREVVWATTSNLAVRKVAFFAVGGFVEDSLTVVSGEDVDLGLRLTAAGHRIVCDSRARVVHSATSTASLRTVCRRLYGYGRSEQWLITVHPRHRRARWNPVSALAVTTPLAVTVGLLTRGAGLLLVPLAVVLFLARDVARDLRGDGGGRARPVADALVRTPIEWCFDLGAFVASFQLGRPGLVFAGFREVVPGSYGRGRTVAGAPGGDR